MPSFSNARHVTVNGGSFADVQGNVVTYNIRSMPETGITQLRNEISESVAAFHDSAEHHPPPEHHPETQNEVLARIFEWIQDDQGNNVLWLHGPASVGKSAITQTVAERSAQSKELAASFFFSRDRPGCDSARLLWATIAFQIAISIPTLRRKIGEAVEDDPAICQRSLQNQLQKLIIDPFTSLQRKLNVMNTLARMPFLVIIDGVDECKTHGDQRDVMRSVANIITTHHIPLRFLITSRSEDPIRSEFNSPILQSSCFRIFHAEPFHPENDDQWQVFRSTSESRWQPFFHPDMGPTSTFTTLMDNIFSYLDSSDSGCLFPEVSSGFLDDLGCPLHNNVWKSALHGSNMSKIVADRVLKDVYDLFSIHYVPGERSQALQVGANPARFGAPFGRLFNPSFIPSPPAPGPVPLLTRKGFLDVAVIEMLCDPSRQWRTLSRMLRKFDLPQYRGWGDLPRDVLPESPDQRTVERVADLTGLIKAKVTRELAMAQMGLMMATRGTSGLRWGI